MKPALDPAQRAAAVALSAIALAAVVAFRMGWLAALVGCSPLVGNLQRGTAWSRFGLGFLFCAVFHIAMGASWTTLAIARFSDVGLVHAGGLVSLFIGWQSLGFGVGCAASAGLERVRIPFPLALGATAMAIEWIFPQWLPLSLAAAVPAESLPGQLAAFGGMPLVTGWLVLGSATLASCWVSAGRWRASAALVVALLILPMGRFSADADIGARLSVGLVQTSGGDSTTRERAHAALAPPGERPDLLVWGEGSVGAAYTSQALPALGRRVVRSTGSATLFGADVRVQGPTGEGPLFNSALLADAEGVLRGRHDKERLLGLGETLALPPFDTLFGRLLPRREAQSYTPGASSQPSIAWNVRGHTVALDPLLCLEDIYPLELPPDDRDGLVVSLSNDAWFTPSLEARLHDSLARYRAIESGRFFVRVASGGLSAVYDARGRQRLVAPEGEAWVGSASISLRPANTFYLRVGAARLRAIAAATLAIACLGLALRRRSLAIPSDLEVSHALSSNRLYPSLSRLGRLPRRLLGIPVDNARR